MPAETDYEGRARLADALARGENISAAARFAGYSRENVRLLLRDNQEFVAQVEKRKADLGARPETPFEVVAGADERLALDTLRGLAVDAERETDRIAAAKALLTYSSTRKKLAGKVTANKPPPLRIVPDEDAAKRFLAGGK